MFTCRKETYSCFLFIYPSYNTVNLLYFLGECHFFSHTLYFWKRPTFSFWQGFIFSLSTQKSLDLQMQNGINNSRFTVFKIIFLTVMTYSRPFPSQTGAISIYNSQFNYDLLLVALFVSFYLDRPIQWQDRVTRTTSNHLTHFLRNLLQCQILYLPYCRWWPTLLPWQPMHSEHLGTDMVVALTCQFVYGINSEEK